MASPFGHPRPEDTSRLVARLAESQGYREPVAADGRLAK
jgi:hypothetical protein